MIKRIHIENFKSIQGRVTIDLKPITLLFGPNSSGKSTILHALHYAREILDRHNFNAHSTINGGKYVDLGGFDNMVNGHDRKKNIVLQFDLDLEDKEVLEYWNTREGSTPVALGSNWAQEMVQKINTAYLKLEIAWVSDTEAPEVIRYEVGINDKYAARITRMGEKIFGITNINFSHDIFDPHEHGILDRGTVSEMATHLHLLLDDFSQWETGEEIEEKKRKLAEAKDDKEKSKINDELSSLYESLNIVSLTIESQTTAIPKWKEIINIKELPSNDDFQGDGTTKRSGTRGNKLDFQEAISVILTGIGDTLNTELNKFRYIGPIREVPDRNYNPKHYNDESRWANGLGAWDSLTQNGEAFLRQVNNWMEDEERLATGHSFEVKEFMELPLDDPFTLQLQSGELLDIEDVAEKLASLNFSSRLIVTDARTGVEVSLPDVGIGISQVLPIVVGAILQKESILAIEQPELHIHPRIQVNLGDLLIWQLNKTDFKGIFLIETHSEHLLLRLLKRIKQTNKGNLDKNQDPLLPDQLSIIFVDPTDYGCKMRKIGVDENGKFTDLWPQGFFDERYNELF